jgi:tRNA (mo5U34)-methyltransferase
MMTPDEIKSELARYAWYHEIEVADQIVTPGLAEFQGLWKYISEKLRSLDFTGKEVLDISCRDGLFSFQAERSGAKRVVGIDNDLSRGAVEFLIPHFKSQVTMAEMNLYDLKEETFGQFDIVMMFGLLYHLRYPFNGLRSAAKVVKPGGLLAIESAMYCGVPQDLPMLYCPWQEDNPYEPTSTTFFNQKGLVTTLESMGCTLESADLLEGGNPGAPNHVRRGFYVFRRTHDMPAALQQYWEGLHNFQTTNCQTSVRADQRPYGSAV